MKAQVFLFATLAAAAAFAAAPAVPTATITGSTVADDVLTVTYTLNDGPAVITFDIQTNVTGDVWASIGGEAVLPGIISGNDVLWRKVSSEEGPFTVQWRADAWSGNAANVRAAVTAWPLDNPPNYMVADISTKAHPNTQRYYPEADFVPGGVLGDTRYRKTALLMRKIMAKGITWTMGDSSDNRQVTLTNNYYMGVFQVTQAQWAQVKGDYPAKYNNLAAREMRPVENVSYDGIRVSNSYSTWTNAYEFPNPPHGSSFLGIVRTRTGIDFDLPGDAQWHYAARAGHPAGYWNDGTVRSSATMPGRCSENGGNQVFNSNTNQGTAACGSYKPSSWGIYDMHGNVNELCLDWDARNSSGRMSVSSQSALDYRVNIDPSEPSKPLVGITTKEKAKRGGAAHQSYTAADPSARNSDAHSTRYFNIGFRVICPVEVP